jgi:hypothetical protein
MPTKPQIGFPNASQYLHDALLSLTAGSNRRRHARTRWKLPTPHGLCMSTFGTINAAILPNRNSRLSCSKSARN